MRQRIWRRLFAVAACVVAAAGASSAQQPPAALPGSPAVVAQPAPAVTSPTVPGIAAPVPSPVVVQGNGGCAGCGANGAAAGHAAAGGRGYFMAGPGTVSTRLGSGVNGCGSVHQDLAFVFGSCRSFFAPCGGLAEGCGGRGSCTTPVYGRGACKPYNPCYYDSYLNH